MSDRLSAVLHERLAPAVALDVERRLRARWAGARVWMTWPAATGKFDRGRPSGAAQQLANDVRAALADAGAPGDVRAHDVLLPFAGDTCCCERGRVPELLRRPPVRAAD